MIASRIYLKYFILSLKKVDKKNIVNVAIYGAGEAGAQLASSINLDNKYSIKFFIDDNEELYKIMENQSTHEESITYKDQINTILIAITKLNRSKKLEIFNKQK